MPVKKKPVTRKKTIKKQQRKNVPRILLLLVAVLSTVGLGAYLMFFASEAATPYSNGKIVFSGVDNYAYRQIFTVNSDGSGLTKLTTESDITHGFPKFSPNGKQIAYTRDCDLSHTHASQATNTCIFVMNADGSNKRKLTAGERGSTQMWPTWSPDGKQIAYNNGPYQMRIINIDGTNDHLFDFSKTGISSALSPSWSPDGAHITYTELTPEQPLYMIDAATGANRTVMLPRGGQSPTSWSPDSKSFIYWYYNPSPGREELYRMDVATKTKTKLNVASNLSLRYPILSGDGKQILAMSSTQGKPYIMNADGSNAREWKPTGWSKFIDNVDWARIPAVVTVIQPTIPQAKPKPSSKAVVKPTAQQTPASVGPPTELQAEPEQLRVRLSWIAPNDAIADTTYTLERSLDNQNWETVEQGLRDTYYEDNGVKYQTTYNYRVKAQNSPTVASPYAEVKATTITFEPNTSTTSDVLLASSDGAVKVTLPGGAVQADSSCIVAIEDEVGDLAYPKGKSLIHGYRLICRDSTGKDIESFSKDLSVSVSPPAAWSKRFSKYQVLSSSTNDDDYQPVEYNTESTAYEFSKNGAFKVVILANKKSVLGTIMAVIFLGGGTLLGLGLFVKYLIRTRVMQRSSDYLRQARGY